MSDSQGLDINRVLKFLPYFEADDFRFLYGERGFTCTFSDDIAGFVHVLQETGFIFPFEWKSWSEEAKRYTENPELTREAGLEDLRKLLTTYVEKDKETLGYLISVIREEQVLLILQRLKALHDKS